LFQPLVDQNQKNKIQDATCLERKEDRAPSTQHLLSPIAPERIAAVLPLADGSVYEVTREQVRVWEQTFPDVDVMQQLRSMKAWLDADPRRGRSRSGIQALIYHWLTDKQDQS